MQWQLTPRHPHYLSVRHALRPRALAGGIDVRGEDVDRREQVCRLAARWDQYLVQDFCDTVGDDSLLLRLLPSLATPSVPSIVCNTLRATR